MLSTCGIKDEKTLRSRRHQESFQATRVQFWVDPAVTQSVHHVEAEGACGTLTIDMGNNVAPADGRTSLQTAMSIVQAVRNRVAVLRI